VHKYPPPDQEEAEAAAKAGWAKPAGEGDGGAGGRKVVQGIPTLYSRARPPNSKDAVPATSVRAEARGKSTVERLVQAAEERGACEMKPVVPRATPTLPHSPAALPQQQQQQQQQQQVCMYVCM